MKSRAVVKFFKGVSKTSRALGLTTQAIYKWGTDVPESRVSHVEACMKLEQLYRDGVIPRPTDGQKNAQ